MSSHYVILHLSLIESIGSGTISALLRCINGADLYEIYTWHGADFISRMGISEQKAQIIVDGLTNKKLLEKELQLLEKHYINWITIADAHYPALLREIPAPPAVLYWQGASLEHNDQLLAIVGSRAATYYTKQILEQCIQPFVEQNWTIVSGGALGADTMAHKFALANNGKTIAVLGSGLLMPYPAQNRQLFDEIVYSGGSVISPFPLQMTAMPGNFPARNRIIAGLSRGCLVTQAAIKSGALITAKYAMDYGREVFAVPGPFNDPLSAGCHWLLQQGAKLVCHATDMFVEFGIDATNKIENNNFQTEIKQTPIEQACQQPSSLEELHEITQLSLPELQLHLFELQIEGKIQQNFAGLWEKV